MSAFVVVFEIFSFFLQDDSRRLRLLPFAGLLLQIWESIFLLFGFLFLLPFFLFLFECWWLTIIFHDYRSHNWWGNAFFFVQVILELFYHSAKLLHRPLVEVICAFLKAQHELLELFGVIVLFNDLLEKKILLL